MGVSPLFTFKGSTQTCSLILKGTSPAARWLNLHLVLTQALSQAVRWGYIGTNPAAGAQPPRPRRAELSILDEAATKRILAAVAGTRLECPVAIAIATGMRRGEILALRWSDIDAGDTIAHVRRSMQATTSGARVREPQDAQVAAGPSSYLNSFGRT